VPVVKISSNTPLAERKKNWIDFNAGELVDGVDLNTLADHLLDQILSVASGALTKNEEMGYRDFAIWKSGVTL
jgi:altronate hydrolase